MGTLLTKGTICIAAACAAAVAQASTGGGNLNIAPGLLGFGVPSSAGAPEPCVGTGTPAACYGVPSGIFVVPMEGLVAPGASGLFFVSVETLSFSGTATTTFKLAEAGAVVLELSATGTISPNSKAFLGQAGTIPSGAYTGPATLTAETKVTPGGGGSGVTLTAETSLWILPPAGGGAVPRVAQVAVGFGVPPPPGPQRVAPCVGTGAADNCYGAPTGLLVLPLNLLYGATGANLGGVFFVATQTAMLNSGSANTVFQFAQGGTVLETFENGGELLFPYRFAIFAPSAYVPGTAEAGPATLTATTTVEHEGSPIGTVVTSIGMEVQ